MNPISLAAQNYIISSNLKLVDIIFIKPCQNCIMFIKIIILALYHSTNYSIVFLKKKLFNCLFLDLAITNRSPKSPWQMLFLFLLRTDAIFNNAYYSCYFFFKELFLLLKDQVQLWRYLDQKKKKPNTFQVL